MKNFLLSLIIVVFFVGCASSTPKSYISTSSPIFVLEKPQDKKVFIDFKDLDEPSNHIQIFLENELKKEQFNVVYDEKIASIIVRGAINFLKRDTRRNTRGFVSMGVGFGSGGRVSRNVGFGVQHRLFGDDFGDDYYDRDYRYDGQASLLIRIKNRDKFDNYSTNLNFFTDENAYSKGQAKAMFNKQIAKKVIEYLGF